MESANSSSCCSRRTATTSIGSARSTCIRTPKPHARLRGGAGEDAPGISFLKEQQWSLDFGTAVVTEQAVRESIRVPARLEARPGGAADVVAPIDGRLTRVVESPLGASVIAGQELARLLPPPSVPGDLPQLQRARPKHRRRWPWRPAIANARNV